MKSLPRSARIYIAVLGLAASGGALGAFIALARSPKAWFLVALFGALVCLADLFPIVFPFPGAESAETTVSGAIKAAAAVLFGPTVAVCATLLGTLTAELLLRRAWYKTLFNVAQMTLTFGVMGVYYHAVSDGSPSPLHSLANIGGLFVLAAVYFVLNTGMVSLVVALADRVPVTYIWKANIQHVVLHDLTVMPMGALIAVCWAANPWTIFLLLLPLLLVRQAMLQASTLQRQTTDTLLALVDAIDERDASTHRHSQRVAEYAGKVAREMGLPMEQVDVIAMSARLHDLGKIGMSNDLLYKPKQFTQEELEEFRRHPAIGAHMVQHFSLFRKGHSLMLHHHERYDGGGYPDGLAGEAIPVGSRIISIADSFEAMTADRPYRKAMSVAEAALEVFRQRGIQFDPGVADAMLAVLQREHPELNLPTPPVSELDARRRRTGRAAG